MEGENGGVLILKEIMRQKDEFAYCTMLNNSRFGMLTAEDRNLLRGRLHQKFTQPGLAKYRQEFKKLMQTWLQSKPAPSGKLFKDGINYREWLKRYPELKGHLTDLKRNYVHDLIAANKTDFT